jgi:hypothetical protein
MTKKELAFIIHEYNTACPNQVKPEESCPDCWRVAGQIMIALGQEIVHAGVEPLKK